MPPTSTCILMRCTAALVLALGATRLSAQVAVYHGVSAATHQSQWFSLLNQGYRPLSISVSGGLAAQRYSAVWVVRAGPQFVGVHGLTRTQYSNWRSGLLTAGFRPFIVTASGAGSDEVFAAVWVNDGVSAVDEFQASSSSLQARMDWAWANGYIPTRLEEYGTSTAPLFCGVWEEYSGDGAWGYSIQDSSSEHQANYDAHTEAHARPAFVDVSDRQTYSAIWRDDQLNGSWSARHNLTAAEFQTEIDNRPGQFPLFVQCGGSGSAARWTAVFVTSDAIRARSLSRTGLAVNSLAAFDSYLTGLVQDRDARAAAIAIAKDGRLVYARGYTWAESGYPITQPTSMFRIASCSKPLAALGAHVLDQDSRNALSMSTLVGANLGLSGSDPDFNAVRVRHTIQHSSGILRDTDAWTIAQWVNPSLVILPVSAWATCRYAATRSLAFTPGTADQYSNVAYTLLGQVLENVAGKTYERILREDLAAPLGITRLWIGGSRRADLRSGEVYYHDDRLTLAASDLHSDRRPLAGTYGGGTYGYLPRIDAPGGVVTSAVDYVRILTGCYDLAKDGVLLTTATASSALAAPLAPVAVDLGGFAQDARPNGVIAHGKSGVLNGVSSQVIYRSDGISIAVFVNRSNSHANRTTLNQLAEAVTDWPTHDLWSQHGLTPFPRVVPRIHATPVASLPNLTDAAFVVEGEVLSGVDKVEFGLHDITSQLGTSWSDGWFRIVSDNRLEIFPPQGLLRTTYSVRLWNGTAVSAPFDLALTSTPSLALGGPATAFAGYELIAARGGMPSNSLALLCFSPSSARSTAPGLVDLGLGAGFTQLFTWPTLSAFNVFTGCARWQIPDLGVGTWHFQALVVDPNLRDPTPFPVTNVRSVRGL